MVECGRMETSGARRGPFLAVRWCVALLPCVWSACATTPSASVPEAPPDLGTLCVSGSLYACDAWGRQLLAEGRQEEAADAYGHACHQGDTTACLTEGRLRMEQGDLDGAEPPLRRSYDASMQEGALALADLQVARGDDAGAERYRFESLSIDKSVVELVLGYRFGMVGGSAVAMDLNVQPMAFLARRLNVGASVVLSTSYPSRGELNGYVGYQHFVSDWAAPYMRVLAGSYWHSRGTLFNGGMEAGMKVFAGPLGHAGLGVGTSLHGATYMSLELGLDWIVALAILSNLH
jgi:hypothetical protein